MEKFLTYYTKSAHEVKWKRIRMSYRRTNHIGSPCSCLLTRMIRWYRACYGSRLPREKHFRHKMQRIVSSTTSYQIPVSSPSISPSSSGKRPHSNGFQASSFPDIERPSAPRSIPMWIAQGLTFLIPMSGEVCVTISTFRSSSLPSLKTDIGNFSINLAILLDAGMGRSPSVILSLHTAFVDGQN